VFRPAVLRANRLAQTEILSPGLTSHALRHTYASLCVAAGIPPLQLSRFMGHAKVTTTLAIYTHLFADDHTETMAALEAMSRPVTPTWCQYGGGVRPVPLPRGPRRTASTPLGR
jgi:integrase